jgi:hypothetical protein
VIIFTLDRWLGPAKGQPSFAEPVTGTITCATRLPLPEALARIRQVQAEVAAFDLPPTGRRLELVYTLRSVAVVEDISDDLLGAFNIGLVESVSVGASAKI